MTMTLRVRLTSFAVLLAGCPAHQVLPEARSQEPPPRRPATNHRRAACRPAPTPIARRARARPATRRALLTAAGASPPRSAATVSSIRARAATTAWPTVPTRRAQLPASPMSAVMATCISASRAATRAPAISTPATAARTANSGYVATDLCWSGSRRATRARPMVPNLASATPIARSTAAETASSTSALRSATRVCSTARAGAARWARSAVTSTAASRVAEFSCHHNFSRGTWVPALAPIWPARPWPTRRASGTASATRPCSPTPAARPTTSSRSTRRMIGPSSCALASCSPRAGPT